MNLPNKMTTARLVMAPLFFISFLLFRKIESLRLVFLVLMLVFYAAAEITDLLDGKIARKRGLVTDLGKVMDPFADTISHATYFLCFVMHGIMPLWAFVIIMWREYAVLFSRMLMAKFAGKAMSANIFGKAKTVLYAVSSFLAIAFMAFEAFAPGAWIDSAKTVLYVFFALSAAASAFSFIVYVRSIVSSGLLKDMTR